MTHHCDGAVCISGYVVGFKSLGPVIDVFAKGGVVNWKSKITDGSSKLFDRDGTDLAYGSALPFIP
jgi:hypothetical protein